MILLNNFHFLTNNAIKIPSVQWNIKVYNRYFIIPSCVRIPRTSLFWKFIRFDDDFKSARCCYSKKLWFVFLQASSFSFQTTYSDCNILVPRIRDPRCLYIPTTTIQFNRTNALLNPIRLSKILSFKHLCHGIAIRTHNSKYNTPKDRTFQLLVWLISNSLNNNDIIRCTQGRTETIVLGWVTSTDFRFTYYQFCWQTCWQLTKSVA